MTGSASDIPPVGMVEEVTREDDALEDELGVGEMVCPACGSAIPDLKGGRATICPVCGFKDSCCF